MADDKAGQTNLAAVKDYLVLIPILGSTLGITFEVAYFAGVGLRFFSFFSLSEHLVFAMEILPFGIIMAFVLGLLASLQTRVKTLAIPGPRSSMSTASYIAGVAVAAVAFSFIGSASFPFADRILNWVVLIGCASTTVFLLIALEIKTLLIRTAFLCMAAMALALMVGYLAGRASVRADVGSARIETKNNGELTVKLIRSGDRGVLFFDETTKQVTLLRWDEIKQISTARAP
jgi:hypothetical protein